MVGDSQDETERQAEENTSRTVCSYTKHVVSDGVLAAVFRLIDPSGFLLFASK